MDNLEALARKIASAVPSPLITRWRTNASFDGIMRSQSGNWNDFGWPRRRRRTRRYEVRFGSFADTPSSSRHVCFTLKADIATTTRNVGYGPEAELAEIIR